jgi:tRNA(Ile)-lysidine synthase
VVKRFIKFLKEECLINITDKILLGVSGGMDSVVMLELFSRTELFYGIAHCNFGLRGEESDADNSFVAMLSQKYNVPYHSKKFDTLSHSKKKSISIQMAARELRINWFEEIIKDQDYHYYATAHHLDDQIETILNNFFRGTGITGLHGILPINGNLIHPMLFCYRDQIEAFSNKHQLDYRSDSSNEKTDYTRNRIRHQLIPVIRKIYPNYRKTISDNTYRIRQVEKIYNTFIQQLTNKLVEENQHYITISSDKLNDLESPDTILYEIIKAYGFNYFDAMDILSSINSNSCKSFLSNTHKITKDRTELIIEEKSNIKPQEYLIYEDEFSITTPISLKLQLLEYKNNFKISRSASIANLDHKKLKYPLKLRKWEKGDYFYPLGMNNKKLVSDFFIDNKFSVPEKVKTWLLISEEQIVWIIGHRIDNRFKISENTTHVLTIEYFE